MMMAEPSGGTTRVRSPGLGLGLIVLALVAAATAGAVQEDQLWIVACATVVAVLSVGLVMHTALSSVQASADGLVSRSPWRRPRRLGWKQIHRFEVRGFWRVLGLWTSDDHWVALMPYGAFSAEAMRALGRLEEHRRRQADPNP